MVEVTDMNDNPPQLLYRGYTATIPEMMSVGSAVVTLEATDRDVGRNAYVTYTVLENVGTDFRYFYADSIYVAGTGVIRIKEVIIAMYLNTVNVININLHCTVTSSL